MDEEGLALVLSRALELLSKIKICIENSSSSCFTAQAQTLTATPNTEYEYFLEETETLMDIGDSLEAYARLLSSLQKSQEELRDSEEAFLARIDDSRRNLLENLKAYKGENLDVIREANDFASSRVEWADLLLPPYPSHTTSSLDSVKVESNSRSSLKGLRKVVGAAAKMVFPVVGFIAVMHLSGFGFGLRKRGTSEFKLLGMAQEHGNDEKTETTVECPPLLKMV